MNVTGGNTASVAAVKDITTDVLISVSQIDAIKDQWRALSLAQDKSSFFEDPSVFDAWRKTLSDDVQFRVVTVHINRDLIGVMPLMLASVRRGPLCAPRHDFSPSDRKYMSGRRVRPFKLRQISAVVSMPATYVCPSPLCKPSNLVLVTQQIARKLAKFQKWDVIALPVYETSQQPAWFRAFKDAGLKPHLHQLDRHIQSIENIVGFDEIVARQKQKFRQNIRRARAAADRVGLSIRVYSGQKDVQKKMHVLAEVANASWKDSATPKIDMTIPYAGAQQKFFETLIKSSTGPDGVLPILAVATVDGVSVAAMLSFQHGECLTTAVTFMNGQHRKTSPGMLVMGRMIDYATEQKIRRIELNATHPWVRNLVNNRKSQNIILCFAPTLRGAAFGAISGLTRRLR